MAKKPTKSTGKTPAKPKAKPAKAKPAKARTVGTKPVKTARKPKLAAILPVPPLDPAAPDAKVLDRLWSTIVARQAADPLVSHSARLLSRGINKVAQKFGEESVECLIEAVAGNREALIAESADVLYHLLVMWVACSLRPEDVWTELKRREAISGIAEKNARPVLLSIAETRKIP
ncbi:phosphoribosyl-ATP diphosphatase [Acidiphilium acidophilum]|uniref:phosphoribosyl-ATP diphosphatase n=1 Tax=Acidiphilium acidophilum TaxID=76588 RepID=UPI002E8E6314|nr:phosphoribosyl-ATP diphosphatase [Acidiphilium acidophilum]